METQRDSEVSSSAGQQAVYEINGRGGWRNGTVIFLFKGNADGRGATKKAMSSFLSKLKTGEPGRY